MLELTKVETEIVIELRAFANCLYSTHTWISRKNVEWDFQEKSIPGNVWAWAYVGKAGFPRNSKKVD